MASSICRTQPANADSSEEDAGWAEEASEPCGETVRSGGQSFCRHLRAPGGEQIAYSRTMS